MPDLTRRTVLRLTAAAVPALALGCRRDDFDAAAVPESTTRFPRTPMAGDMTADRAMLAFHVADDKPVTLRVWSADGIVVDRAIEPSGDGFHKVALDALSPGTDYEYALFTGTDPDFEARSLIGRFRTAPAADASPVVTFALVSCIGQGTILPDFYMPPGTQNPTAEPFRWALFEQAADFDLDAIVHLGDQAYLDFVWSEQGGTVDAYLDAWGYYHGGGYRDLFPHAGLFATWDDHEATDNGQFDPWNMTPEETQKLANAQEAWFKVVPIDAMTPAEGPVWRGFRWGRTVELLLLDCRYELTESQLMSEAQLTWLLDRIAASPCRFVCVATPKPFAAIASDEPLFADNADRWDGFLPQRDRLVARLNELDARHVVFVTGDIHMNYLGRATLDGTTAADRLWEVCTTSGNVSPLASSLSRDQFEFVDNQPHFPVLTFDPDAGTVHVAFHATDGTVTHERTLDDV